MSRLQSLARRFENIRPRPMPGWVFGTCQPQIRTRMKIPANMGTVESSMDQIEQRQAASVRDPCTCPLTTPKERQRIRNLITLVTFRPSALAANLGLGTQE